MAVDRLIIFFNGIPFIDRDNNTFSALMGNSCDLRVLFSHTLCRIDHNNTYIGTLHCRHGTNDTVALNFFLNLILTTESCRINKHVFLSIVTDVCIDCITGCSCNIRYDHTIFLCQFIDQG